jgi:hypothetical protein
VAIIAFGRECLRRLETFCLGWVDSESVRSASSSPDTVDREPREGLQDQLTGDHHGHHDTSAHSHRTAGSLWRRLLWPPALVLKATGLSGALMSDGLSQAGLLP